MDILTLVAVGAVISFFAFIFMAGIIANWFFTDDDWYEYGEAESLRTEEEEKE